MTNIMTEKHSFAIPVRTSILVLALLLSSASTPASGFAVPTRQRGAQVHAVYRPTAFGIRSQPPSSSELPAFRGIRKLFGGKTDAVLEREETAAVTALPDQKEEGDDVLDSAKALASVDEECAVEEKELSETQKLLQQVKDAGTAGIISYALWELGFWFVSVPVVVLGYKAATGHFPDFSNSDDMAKLGAEAFAFVNFARFAVPLRIGLALSTTPWIRQNVVDRFGLFKKKDECAEPDDADSVPDGEV